MTVQTPVQPWTDGAQLPFDATSVSPSTPLHIRIKATVLTGKVGIGLLNRAEDDFVQIEYLSASTGPVTVALTAPDRRDIGPLVIRSAEDSGPAKVVVDSIELMTNLVPAPLTVDWNNIERPAIPLDGFPLEIRTPAKAWAYGAVIPLRVAEISHGAQVWIRVRAHIAKGEAAFGLVSDQNSAIHGETIKKMSDGIQSIMLRADATADPIRLVIQSGPTPSPATIVVDGIDAGTVGQQPDR